MAESRIPKPGIVIAAILIIAAANAGIARAHVGLPSVSCYSCHIVHSYLGPALTTQTTICNLCISCHNDTETAQAPPPSDTSYHQGYYNRVPGEDCTASCTDCHDPHTNLFSISSGGHSAHMAAKRGPQITDCSVCHDVIPFFSGTDSNGDGVVDLDETDVCDNCHSPGGTYDGVNDPEIGAKDNWPDGVYSDSNLASGKEKWCAGCHDEQPAIIQGVAAPEVIGDEDAVTNYGIGYGFYKTGHGLPFYDTYPASGGTIRGAALSCGDCHDPAMKHVDGVARTYVYTAVLGASNDYQHGYRLRSVNGELPMFIPRTESCGASGVNAEDFRLCFRCHDPGPFTQPGNFLTNFRDDNDGVNRHYYHLAIKSECGPGPMYQSDWRATHVNDSRGTCVTCHNVHGSKQLSMVRDGQLVYRTPGLQVLYDSPDVTYVCGGPNPYPPTPADVTLPESTGTVWNANAAQILCWGCHGSCGFNVEYARSPVDTFPPQFSSVYGEVGSDILRVNFSEGVYSNPGAVGDLTTADFALTDLDNSRTIIDVAHTAGDVSAELTLSAPLDSIGDIGTDTLSAATPASIYDLMGNSMDTMPVVISSSDSTPPVLSDQDPIDGAVNVAVDTDVTFILSDSGDGVDWATFSIQLSGNKGYSKTYTDEDFLVVSKTGTPASYNVTVSPDVNFGGGESIEVTVNVDDRATPANSMVPPVWSFTTITPESLILHPSGVFSSGGFNPTGGTWADVLDTNDGDASYVAYCCSSPGQIFYVDLDPADLTDVSINSIKIHVYARCVDGPWPAPSPVVGNVNIGYKTGTSTVWKGNTSTDNSGSYNLITFDANEDSDGGSLDLADVDNLQIAVQRNISGSYQLRVTEVYAEIVYTP